MSENFDSYNAPQFFDFSKDPHEDEGLDTYFEVDHENGELEDPLKCGNNSSYKCQQPADGHIENHSHTKTILQSSESYTEIKEDKYYVDQFSSDKSSLGMDIEEEEEEEATGREKLRRSMSVGNLYPLATSKSKDQSETSNLGTVLTGYTLQKHSQKNTSLNNLKKADSRTNLNKIKTNATSTPRLTGASSREHLNKLAQPKQYSSQNNLNHTGYITMAEAVRKFQCGTPTRFRTKPKIDLTGGNKFGRTIPQSPALLTKQRHRPVTVMSREEQERIEYEESQRYKIKANPLNKRVLQGPVKPLLPIEKKPVTIPEPFKITAAPRKVPMSPKKETFEFHANPVPKTLHDPPKVKEVQKVCTKPQTPTFMKRYVKEPNRQEKQEENTSSHKQLTRTVPMPFSFERRDQIIQKMKEEKIQKVLEDEKKAREFHARPVPKAILNSAKSSNLSKSRSNSVNSMQANRLTKSDDNISNQFKARPPTVLYKKPFEPKKDEQHLIEIEEFQLSTEMRAKERDEFEKQKREKEERIALAKQLEEELRIQREEEERARIRKQAEYRAQPIKKYKELKIEPSLKVTIPESPKFHFNKHRNRENKENLDKNSS